MTITDVLKCDNEVMVVAASDFSDFIYSLKRSFVHVEPAPHAETWALTSEVIPTGRVLGVLGSEPAPRVGWCGFALSRNWYYELREEKS